MNDGVHDSGWQESEDEQGRRVRRRVVRRVRSTSRASDAPPDPDALLADLDRAFARTPDGSWRTHARTFDDLPAPLRQRLEGLTPERRDAIAFVRGHLRLTWIMLAGAVLALPALLLWAPLVLVPVLVSVGARGFAAHRATWWSAATGRRAPSWDARLAWEGLGVGLGTIVWIVVILTTVRVMTSNPRLWDRVVRQIDALMP